MKNKRTVFLDFEFNRIVEKHVNLVCAATLDEQTGERKKWWLHNNNKNQAALRKYLAQFSRCEAYAAVAECRSFHSLKVDPHDWKWIDYFFEYRMITNNNDRMQWGKQLVDGKVKNTRKPRPKWEQEEGEKGFGFKATHSLAEATYKLTGKIRDTEHKKAMRDLIISDPQTFSKKERRAIMKYCMEDVIFLPKIKKAIVTELKYLVPELNLKEYYKEAEERGLYACLTAGMETSGYPINVEATRNFSKEVGNIMYDLQREINNLFPEIQPFQWKKSEGRFAWNQKATRDWIETTPHAKKWMRTSGGKSGNKQLSLAMEAFEKFYQFKHDYPEDNFGAQMVRFLKLKQNLFGFSSNPDAKRKNFWDSVGSDGMVRPYTNPYGAQTSRSQPASTGFMFLKPAWMRALVEPPEGYFMAGIDFGSEEFFLSGLISEDKAMIASYLSGDPYLAFAKLSGQAPQNATKETHKEVRDLNKATILGISYLMSKYGLAVKLTNDTGQIWTEDEAQDQIDLFDETYWKLKDFREYIIQLYSEQRYLKLPDGWYMFGDNENFRSVANMPIQGAGGVVMRRSVKSAYDRGVKVIITNHDALYFMDKIGNEHKILKLRDAMREGFASIFPEEQRKLARKIKLDPFAWSKHYKPDSKLILGKNKWEVPCSNLYIDERAEAEYKKFSKYFKPKPTDIL